ncbi:hypothetical protein QBC38DRAFT_490921 [Podospora fimiseda]|uniref:Uncharacterized protein n=1 Tax=Podospora fimiseda TaxID=252190 RepID=A0AAN6YSV4_9PEZI|nr:hypothetical protein QBC38DRAFT_490921 [Podospora fimiseda]
MAAPALLIPEPPPPRLVHFPPNYIALNLPEVMHQIVDGRYVPSYGNKKRAWHTLGFPTAAGSPKPTKENFENWINELWVFLHHDTTLRGRKARAYVLEALKTLGYRSPRWHVDYKARNTWTPDTKQQMLITHPNAGVEWHGTWIHIPPGTAAAGTPAPARSLFEIAGANSRNWDSLRSPSSDNFGKADGRWFYQQLTTPMPDDSEIGRTLREKNFHVWKKYHAFQGFSAKFQNTVWYFHAVKIPSGPNSLWASVAYHVQPREFTGTGNNIFRHWLVKARIWTYFMQTLAEPQNIRWVDYHILQWRSEKVTQQWGRTSLARSLFAGKHQGEAAYSPEQVFHVISDYFDTQVIVFYPGIEGYSPGQYRDQMFNPQTWQGHALYEWKTYGFLNTGKPQILLFTYDWKNFSPVEHDDRPAHVRIGYSREADPGFDPQHPDDPPERGLHPDESAASAASAANPKPRRWARRKPMNRRAQFGYARQIGIVIRGPIPGLLWWGNDWWDANFTANRIWPGGQYAALCNMARYNCFERAEHLALIAAQAGAAAGGGHVIPILTGDPPELDEPWMYAPIDGCWGEFPDPADPSVSNDIKKWYLTPRIRARFEAGTDIPGRMFKMPTWAQIENWITAPRAVGVYPNADDFLATVQDHENDEGAQWRFGLDPMHVAPENALPSAANPNLPRHWCPVGDGARLDAFFAAGNLATTTRENGKLMMEEVLLEFDPKAMDGEWASEL